MQNIKDSLTILKRFKLMVPIFLTCLLRKFKVSNTHGLVTGRSGFVAGGYDVWISLGYPGTEVKVFFSHPSILHVAPKI